MGNCVANRRFSGEQVDQADHDSSAAISLRPSFRQAPRERGLAPEWQPSLTARTHDDQWQPSLTARTHDDQWQPSLTARTHDDQQQQLRERPPPVNRRNSSNDKRGQVKKKYGYIPDNYTSLEQGWSSSPSQPSMGRRIDRKRSRVMKKYAFIPDNYTTVDQVTAALREAGLESSNLIVGIDFTKSNEWTGKQSFRGQSLHKLGDQPNPYEQAITIIGKVMAPFDDDNLIPCYGFGDMTTHDTHVFSFHPDNSPCQGFEEVLSCYKKIVPHLRLAGPTSFAPIVEAAVDIIERNQGQYHVLLIIADGQVTRSVDTEDDELSPQERKTIDSIVMASAYPLSIVLVGVGDGPWDDMKKFDDKIPARDFDNFQFVNFTAIMGRSGSAEEKEAAFALAALMEVPLQYKATMELGILGHVTGKAKRVTPLPPPLPAAQAQRPYMPQKSRRPERSNTLQRSNDDQSQTCPVCLTNAKDTAFGCGHLCCRECADSLIRCPICRTVITSRLRVYTG